MSTARPVEPPKPATGLPPLPAPPTLRSGERDRELYDLAAAAAKKSRSMVANPPWKDAYLRARARLLAHRGEDYDTPPRVTPDEPDFSIYAGPEPWDADVGAGFGKHRPRPRANTRGGEFTERTTVCTRPETVQRWRVAAARKRLTMSAILDEALQLYVPRLEQKN